MRSIYYLFLALLVPCTANAAEPDFVLRLVNGNCFWMTLTLPTHGT